MDATREVKSLLRFVGRIKSIESVEDEVEKELAHLFWIDPQERDFVKLEVVSDMFEPMFARKGDQVKDFSEIGLLSLSFVASAQEAVFGEQVAKAFDLVGDHIESIVKSERSDIGAHGLDHGLDASEGVADLVDHHGGKSAHLGEFFEPSHLPLEVFKLSEVADADEDLFLLVGRSNGGASVAENTGVRGVSDTQDVLFACGFEPKMRKQGEQGLAGQVFLSQKMLCRVVGKEYVTLGIDDHNAAMEFFE